MRGYEIELRIEMVLYYSCLSRISVFGTPGRCYASPLNLPEATYFVKCGEDTRRYPGTAAQYGMLPCTKPTAKHCLFA